MEKFSTDNTKLTYIFHSMVTSVSETTKNIQLAHADAHAASFPHLFPLMVVAVLEAHGLWTEFCHDLLFLVQQLHTDLINASTVPPWCIPAIHTQSSI